jgi:hypothetical protein
MPAAQPPAARDFTVRLSTGKWRVVLRPCEGLTIYDQTIVINTPRENEERLDTIVHEALHASNYKLTEAEVTRMANDISSVLWKAGYRRSV